MWETRNELFLKGRSLFLTGRSLFKVLRRVGLHMCVSSSVSDTTRVFRSKWEMAAARFPLTVFVSLFCVFRDSTYMRMEWCTVTSNRRTSSMLTCHWMHPSRLVNLITFDTSWSKTKSLYHISHSVMSFNCVVILITSNKNMNCD